MTPTKVFIIDDDQFLAETLAEILSTESAEVVICRTGREALEAIRNCKSGIALVDVRLPDIGGIELLGRLRQAAPDLDIVVVTGNASVHSAIEALNLGASRYILKPCAPDELLSIVRDLSERQTLRARNRLYMRRLEIQNSLSEALARALKPEEVAEAAVEALRRAANVQGAVLLAYEDSSSDSLKALAWSGMGSETATALAKMPEVLRFLKTPLGMTGNLPGMVAVTADKEMEQPGVFCPVALYRLRGQGRDLGALAVITKCGEEPDEEQEVLLNAISNWVAVALERANLYSQLETAYSELKNAQRRLVQAEKQSAIGRLAAGLAHEVGTPLNIISGRAEYMLETFGDNQVLAQGLNVIVGQIERISSLIRQLLDFAREHSPARSEVNLADVLKAVLPLMEVQLRKRRISLEVRVPEAMPLVLANFNQLQQVFINLLMNAMDAVVEKFGPKDGRGRIVIDVEVSEAQQELVVKVEDNGQGIKEEHLDKVFEPFFSTKEVGAGTGLGLAVVYGIITDHGGTIEVESRYGEGTTMTFTLPIVRGS